MAAKVFGVTELLEKILLELPMTDLLLIQRVSRQFKSTIDGSITIQQALFFKPLPSKADKLDWADPEARSNPLLCGPFLTGPFGKIVGCDEAFWLKQDLRKLRPESSAWNMLLTQPPTRSKLVTDREYDFQDDKMVSHRWGNVYGSYLGSTNFPTLEYKGESLGEYFDQSGDQTYRHGPQSTVGVLRRLGRDREVLSIGIGVWHHVAWVGMLPIA